MQYIVYSPKHAAYWVVQLLLIKNHRLSWVIKIWNAIFIVGHRFVFLITAAVLPQVHIVMTIYSYYIKKRYVLKAFYRTIFYSEFCFKSFKNNLQKDVCLIDLILNYCMFSLFINKISLCLVYSMFISCCRRIETAEHSQILKIKYLK